MKTIANMKHAILLVIIISVLTFLTFTLQKSDFDSINKIDVVGANYLSENEYLEIANIINFRNDPQITINVIEDRIEKNPYISHADVAFVERGIVKIKLFEKKMDAVLLTGGKQFMITDKAEIIPFFPKTKNIDLPVIVNVNKDKKIKPFDFAGNYKNLLSALDIISTAVLYDKNLYKQISEINLNNGQSITLTISDLQFPIYLGKKNEVEKTVYLSKIIKHLRGNNLSNYLEYVDLRFSDLVYLGFDNKLVVAEGKI